VNQRNQRNFQLPHRGRASHLSSGSASCLFGKSLPDILRKDIYQWADGFGNASEVDNSEGFLIGGGSRGRSGLSGLGF